MSEADQDYSIIVYHQPGHLKSVNTIREIDGYIFTGGQEGRVCIWDKKLDSELGCIYAHNAPITDIQGTTDLKYLVTTAQELIFKIWSLVDFKFVDSAKAHISAMLGAKSWKEYIISASKDLQLKKWKIVNKRLKLTEKTRIISMDKYFFDEDRIYISTIEGDKIVLEAENFKQVKSLFVNDAKVLKAIRKGMRYIDEFKKQDPHALLFNISRRNGFPILSFKATPDLIMLGHEFGFVSIWNKKTLKLITAFFVNGKHITGIEIENNCLYATSLDSTFIKFDINKQKPVKIVNLPDKPLSLLKTSNNEFVVGLGNGDIILFDTEMEIKNKHNGIKLITGADITPQNLVIALNSGEIIIVKNTNLELIKRKKIHDKPILGIFYYEGNLITVSEDNRILVLNENLEIRKEVIFSDKKTQVRKIKQYISLNSNHVFDLRKLEIIKGEISIETEKKLKNLEIFTMLLNKGDALFKIQKEISHDNISKETREYYSEEIIDSLKILLESSENSLYRQVSESTILLADTKNKQKL